MKKARIALFALALAGGIATAESITSIGVGWTLAGVGLETTAERQFDTINGPALSTFLYTSLGSLPAGFYTSLAASLPLGYSTVTTPTDTDPVLTESPSLTLPVIVDLTVGFGAHFKTDSPLAFFVGAGPAISLYSYSTTTSLANFFVNSGLGFDASASFQLFTGFSLVLTLKDTFCPNTVWALARSTDVSASFQNSNSFCATLGIKIN